MSASSKDTNSGGTHHGWSTRPITLTLVAILAAQPALAQPPDPDPELATLLTRIAVGVILLLFGQAVIPLVKAWIQLRQLRATFRSYLRAQVKNTLDSFGGAGSTNFAQELGHGDDSAEWFTYLKQNNLGVPAIFPSIVAVIDKALNSDDYIPSVSYFGLDGHSLDHTNPVWQLKGPVAELALQYFLTQQQVETSIDYQYEGWYFDLMSSKDRDKRERWCRGLENVLFDMAQHYKAACDLQAALK